MRENGNDAQEELEQECKYLRKNFDKSETIRLQQKDLIQKLKDEIIQLKKNQNRDSSSESEQH